MKLILRILSDKQVRNILIIMLEYLVVKTDNKLDDKILAEIKDKLC